MGQLNAAENQWLFQNISAPDRQRQELEWEWHKLAEERKQLEADIQAFQKRQQLEEQRRERQNHLFDMKWKILEDELKKLAQEKQQLEIEKEQYGYYQETDSTPFHALHREMFFSGVENEEGMRKRYRELLKIYHPDNRDGDTTALQVINQEYDQMKKQFCQ